MKIVGMFLVLLGICVGCFCGIWWAFIGGIVEAVQAVRSEEFQTTSFSFGVLRIICASFIGYLSAALFILPGYAMLQVTK